MAGSRRGLECRKNTLRLQMLDSQMDLPWTLKVGGSCAYKVTIYEVLRKVLSRPLFLETVKIRLDVAMDSLI